MAQRQTRLVIKNSLFPSQTLPSNGILLGEPLVNLGDGILYFTGGTSGIPTWVDSGNATSGYFEVGSNLYQLKIRDKIISYSGLTNLSGKFLSGTTNGFELADISNIQGADTYVTGGTLTTSASDNSNIQTVQLSYNVPPVGGPYSINTENTYTTGGTYDNNTKLISYLRNDGSIGYTVDLSNVDTNDTYVTGFTYNPSTNTLTIEQNEGESPLSQTITTVSGLSFSNLTQGRVVYVGPSGLLTDESEFTYNEGTDTLGVTNIEASGDVTIQGSLKVFGSSISAFTSELYVEDPNITLNYNPTGSTTLTSVGSGWEIQDGSGIANTATTLNIGVSYLNANLNPNTEYTSPTGNQNRNFYTQLNDIIIRNTNYNSSAPNGVRVLAEGDILDGGSY
jgi:hypothetical protein